MADKPTLILDAWWRRVDELFSPADRAALNATHDVVWGRDESIPDDILGDALTDASVLIAADPRVDAAVLERAPHLQTVIEVSGAFPDTIDYAACVERGVEVLGCAPGFRESVAEMALGMAIGGARGLMAEHERFRTASERWLNDNTETDFSLFGADIGFVGYGSIARETRRLLAPFNATIRAFDPWLPSEVAEQEGVELVELEALLRSSRCLFVMAAPTRSNRGMIGCAELAMMPRGAMLVLASRAHLVDFEAVVDAAATGAIRAAIDVFPNEPLPEDHRLRQVENCILSPHRAAAVAGGRQLIGRMIVDDLQAIIQGRDERRLQRVSLDTINELAGTSDAESVGSMATERQ